jgi:hypothetical protein
MVNRVAFTTPPLPRVHESILRQASDQTIRHMVSSHGLKATMDGVLAFHYPSLQGPSRPHSRSPYLPRRSAMPAPRNELLSPCGQAATIRIYFICYQRHIISVSFEASGAMFKARDFMLPELIQLFFFNCSVCFRSNLADTTASFTWFLRGASCDVFVGRLLGGTYLPPLTMQQTNMFK